MAEAQKYPQLTYLASQLGKALTQLTNTTTHLLGLGANPNEMLADATLYLELFGIITIAWQWLRQATVAQAALDTAEGEEADFYHGKIMTAHYFYEYELVKTLSLAQRLHSPNRVTLAMQPNWF